MDTNLILKMFCLSFLHHQKIQFLFLAPFTLLPFQALYTFRLDAFPNAQLSSCSNSAIMDMNEPASKCHKTYIAQNLADYVLFQVQGHEELIKIKRSLVVNGSNIFKRMISDGMIMNDPMRPILIDYKTEFDLKRGFLAFVDAVKDVPMNTLEGEVGVRGAR